MRENKGKAIQNPGNVSGEESKYHENFMSYMKRKNHSPRTIEAYLHELGIFLSWCKNVKAVTPSTIRDYQNFLSHSYIGVRGKPLSAASASRNLTAIKCFYNALKRSGLIIKNPLNNIKLPKVPKRSRKSTLEIMDIRQMLELPVKSVKDIRDKAMVYLLAASGIRATSLAKLDIYDIDVKRREVLLRNPKGGKSYVTFFTSGCGLALTEYLNSARPCLVKDNDSNRLFITDTGKVFDRSLVRLSVLRIAGNAGMTKKVHPHLFRHFLCTTLLERGANVRVVSEIAGHSRLSTTTAYAEVSSSLMANTVNSTHPRGQL